MSQALDLHGKTALVTGASSGIGRALALVLARDVAALVLVARRRDRLDALAGEIRAAHPSVTVVVREVDLTDRAATGAMLDGLASEGVTVDVLVNNAGFGDRGLVHERPWDKLEALLELNVVTVTYLIRRLLPGMLERGAGGILNVGSIAGIVTRPGSAVYGASKSYVNALTEALHSELAGTGVVVTGMLPGPVATEFGAMATKGDAAPVGHARSGESRRDPMPMPDALAVPVETCAELGVRALVRGDARVIPGARVRAMATLMDNTPRPLLRRVLAGAAKKLRT
jgi:short-subunit dehydrogenase